MIITVFTIFAALYIGGLLTLVIMWWTAPEGFEDEGGFHYGAEKRPRVVRPHHRGGSETSPGRRSAVGTGTPWNTA